MEKQINPAEVLREFYASRGIKDNDLTGKLEAMLKHVIIPNLPPNEIPTLYELENITNLPADITPTLCELETRYLREKGIKL